MDSSEYRKRASERFRSLLSKVSKQEQVTLPAEELEVTPSVFFELFILCLSWQWDPTSFNKTFTTVDKVSRILRALGLIKKSQRQNLYLDRRVQFLFIRHSHIVRSGTGLTTTGEILNVPRPLVIALPLGPDINRNRILRDRRIHLTFAGKKTAATLEGKYAPYITREKYQAACLEDKAKKPKAMGAVASRYRARVALETEE